MKRLYYITGLIVMASAAHAIQIYQLPTTKILKDSDRLYVFQNSSSNRDPSFKTMSAHNITGSALKYQVLGGDGPLIKQAQLSYSSVNAGTPNSIHRRISEMKDRTGKIIQYFTAAGRMVIGTPKALAVDSVSPVSGTTGLFNNYSVRACALSNCSTMTGVYWKGKLMTTPVYVQYNKGAGATTSQQFIVGKTLGFDTTMSSGTKIQFLPFSSAANTTYTLRVLRQAILQTDGEWTSSCGSSMTDAGGYCESTFSTR